MTIGYEISEADRIKLKGLELGFSHVGIIPCRDFDEYAETYRSRPAYRYFVENNTKFLDGCYPSKFFPQGKSIIVATYGYSDIDYPKALLERIGRIYLARCYVPIPEIIAGRRLSAMTEFLQNERMDVYSGPIELPARYCAYQAGVVWYANNNFAGTDEDGTFIVIYTWIVDRVLDYDTPTPSFADADHFANGCPKDCTLCKDACPTSAIVDRCELDPAKCILMNDLSPVIDPSLADKMGEHIHGCDVCQVVCPRNRESLNKPKKKDPFLEEIAEFFSLERILFLESFDDPYYKDILRPIMYNYIQDIDIFRKNAAMAMGNSGDVRYIPLLEDAARRFDGMPSSQTIFWAIDKLRGA